PSGDGRLVALDWLTGTTPSTGRPLIPAADGDVALNFGRIALDSGGTLFFWSGKALDSVKQPASATDWSRVDVGPQLPKAQPTFGADGALYLEDVESRVLLSVLPELVLSDLSKEIASDTNVRITGSGAPTINARPAVQ